MTIHIPLPKHFDQFLIREWTTEDARQLADIEFDPEVKRYLKLPPMSKEEYLDKFQLDTTLGWAIAVNPGHIIAGTISMSRFELNPKKRELRILLAKEYRGHGFASEAAQFLASCILDASWVEGVVAVVHPENLDSIVLWKKLGFVYTGEITAERQVYELSRAQFSLSQNAHA